MLYFLIPGIVLRLSVYRGIPVLERLGLNAPEAFFTALGVPLAALLAATVWLTWRDGTPLGGRALTRRWRLDSFRWTHLLWALGAVVVIVVLEGLLGGTRALVIGLSPLLAPPEIFPAVLDPRLSTEEVFAAIRVWGGVSLAGHWGYAAIAWLVFFFNIIGEELFWRGYILPRQELVHGGRTWLVHGLLWNLFHLPIYPWYLIFGLGVTLPLSFVVCHTRSTWVGIIVHALVNVSFPILVTLAVAGRL